MSNGTFVCDGKALVVSMDGTGTLVLDLTNFMPQKSWWYPLVLAKDFEGEFTTVEYVGEQPAYGELRKTTRNGVSGYWYHVGPSALLMVR